MHGPDFDLMQTVRFVEGACFNTTGIAAFANTPGQTTTE
jgi:hypothetical protein